MRVGPTGSRDNDDDDDDDQGDDDDDVVPPPPLSVRSNTVAVVRPVSRGGDRPLAAPRP